MVLDSLKPAYKASLDIHVDVVTSFKDLDVKIEECEDEMSKESYLAIKTTAQVCYVHVCTDKDCAGCSATL